MKKFCSLIVFLIIVASSLSFFSCGDVSSKKDKFEQQGFTAVCKINYISPEGQQTTLNSKYIVEFGDFQEITLEEFNRIDGNVFDYRWPHNFDIQPNKETCFIKGNVLKYYSSEGSSGVPRYYIRKVNSVNEKYIYVKILDADRLEIIDININHYLVRAPGYEITYFI